MSEVARLLQVEFFVIDTTRGESSAEEVIQETFERLEEGSAVIQVLRFKDENGKCAKYCLRQKKHEGEREILFDYYQATNLPKILFTLPLYLYVLWVKRRRQKCQEMIIERLRAISETPDTLRIAIKEGEGFRIVRRDEIHELFEGVEKEHVRFWLFVYEDADLLAAEKSLVSLGELK